MQTNATSQQTILVAGATGTVGGNIVKQLAQAGHRVKALTRNAAKANFLAVVEVVIGDLTAPETLAGALEGVDALHLIKFGGDAYESLETGAEIVALAEKAGVKRLTLLLGGDRNSLEDAIEASSLQWTYIQPVEFMSNQLGWVEQIRSEGIVREAFASRRSAIVHEADIAAVAAVVLAEDGHGGKTYTITGPEVLTPPEMLQMIGAAIGRDLQFVEKTQDEAIEQWRAEGYNDETIQFFLWVFGNTPEMGYTVVPTVEQLTGRAARTFAQWASENADAFRG